MWNCVQVSYVFHIKDTALEMLLRTIYERNQMNRMVNFKGISAKDHACASSNICRMPHMFPVFSVEPTTITNTGAHFYCTNNDNSYIVNNTLKFYLGRENIISSSLSISSHKSRNKVIFDSSMYITIHAFIQKYNTIYRTKSEIETLETNTWINSANKTWCIQVHNTMILGNTWTIPNIDITVISYAYLKKKQE
jgi:hypothetical protein